MSPRALLSQVARLAERLAAFLGRIGRPLEARGHNDRPRPAFTSSDELVKAHFEVRGASDHVNFTSLLATLRMLNEAPSVIVETGSSAWGTDSSRLFDAYVRAFGGRFWTVDIRLDPMVHLRRALSPQSTLVCDDSVRFLERWTRRNPELKADLVYLDSWDLDVDSPLPAAIHGLKELFAISAALRPGSLLLIDDTPGDLESFPEHMRAAAEGFQSAHGMLPGKGMLIDLYLQTRSDVRKVHHSYQVLYRFEGQA